MARQCMALHHHGQRAVFDRVLGLACVYAVQSVVQYFQTALDRIAQIHHVICHTAKRIQSDGGIAYARWQQATGGEKGFRAAAHHVDAGA